MPPLIRPDHRKACERWDTPGSAHYLTCSCFDRKPFLSRDRTRQWLIDSIQYAQQKHNFHLWAYVIMPEHFHLIIWPREKNYRISRILESIKLPVTRKARHFVLTEAPEFAPQMTDRQPNGMTAIRFWLRGGGYDRNLYSLVFRNFSNKEDRKHPTPSLSC